MCLDCVYFSTYLGGTLFAPGAVLYASDKVQGLHEGRATHALWDKLVFGKIKVGTGVVGAGCTREVVPTVLL